MKEREVRERGCFTWNNPEPGEGGSSQRSSGSKEKPRHYSLGLSEEGTLHRKKSIFLEGVERCAKVVVRGAFRTRNGSPFESGVAFLLEAAHPLSGVAARGEAFGEEEFAAVHRELEVKEAVLFTVLLEEGLGLLDGLFLGRGFDGGP